MNCPQPTIHTTNVRHAWLPLWIKYFELILYFGELVSVQVTRAILWQMSKIEFMPIGADFSAVKSVLRVPSNGFSIIIIISLRIFNFCRCNGNSHCNWNDLLFIHRNVKTKIWQIANDTIQLLLGSQLQPFKCCWFKQKFYA